MFEPKLPAHVDEVDLSDIEFWSRPIEEREGAFALLRRERPISFCEEFDPPPEIPLPKGPGYWSVTKHADLLEVSRRAAAPTSTARARASRSPTCRRSSTRSSAR
jgi:hypothetical protein